MIIDSGDNNDDNVGDKQQPKKKKKLAQVSQRTKSADTYIHTHVFIRICIYVFVHTRMVRDAVVSKSGSNRVY